LNDGFYNLDYLNSLDAAYEDEYIRHIRFPEAMLVKIDGTSRKGVVFKPGFEQIVSKIMS
jgi:hypothetical protein